MTNHLHVVLAERLAHLDRAAWRALTAGHGVFLTPEFLEAFEVAGSPTVSPRYALLYDDARPVAAVALQLILVEGRSTFAGSAPLSGMAQWLHERALVLGNLAAWGETGLALAPDVDAGRVWTEVLRVVDALRRFEKSRGGVVNVALVKDAGPRDDEHALRRAGYRLAPSGPDMRLALAAQWEGLDGYLASLTSKSRNAVKKTLKDTAAAGYVLRALAADEVAQHEERLDALYAQVWANADVRPLRLSGRFFAELARRLGDDCRVLVLEREGMVDGFGVCLRSGAQSVGYYLGFDKQLGGAPLYLRLLVAMLEQGIAWRCAEVLLGRTSEEPKARLGAVAGSSSLWVKHRTPPVNWAVGAILGSLEAPPVPSHRVFKETEAVVAGA